MTRPVREWTVLVYMNNDNNLCKGAKGFLSQQLAPLEVSDQVAVALEHSHLREANYYYPPSITHQRAEVGSGKLKVLEDMPAANMADPKTIESFLKWGIQKYPAKHYAIVFQGHGCAWRGSLPDEATRVGEPGDDRASTISLPQLREVMERVERDTGVAPDVLAFDSCLMSNLEAAHELRERAGVLVASEDIMSSTPSEYCLDFAAPLATILERLSSGPRSAPEEFAAAWVDETSRSWTSPTQTALRLDRVGAITEAVDRLAEALLDPSVPAAAIRGAARKARHFGEKDSPDRWDLGYEYKYHLYDLQDLMERFLAEPRLAKAHSAAREVVSAVEASVVAHQAQDALRIEGRTSYGEPAIPSRREEYDGERTHGLSVYLPDRPEIVELDRKVGQDYGGLDLARHTRWPGVIEKVVGAAPAS